MSYNETKMETEIPEIPATAEPETAENTAQTAKYRLTGDVQNIGFRHYLAKTAEDLQIRGWAKNESDGSLIVLLCAEESAIAQMLPHLLQGPVGAAVNNMIELLVEEDDIPPENFDIR